MSWHDYPHGLNGAMGPIIHDTIFANMFQHCQLLTAAACSKCSTSNAAMIRYFAILHQVSQAKRVQDV